MRDPEVVIRPWRVRWVAGTCALAVFLVMVAIAVALREVSTGVYFRTADQVSLIVLGLLIALGVLCPATARVRADTRRIEVRNFLITRELAWSDVLEVSFPAGARWARLELPDDEYLPISAVQLVDGQRAVAAMTRLRALHAAAIPS